MPSNDSQLDSCSRDKYWCLKSLSDAVYPFLGVMLQANGSVLVLVILEVTA